VIRKLHGSLLFINNHLYRQPRSQHNGPRDIYLGVHWYLRDFAIPTSRLGCQQPESVRKAITPFAVDADDIKHFPVSPFRSTTSALRGIAILSGSRISDCPCATHHRAPVFLCGDPYSCWPPPRSLQPGYNRPPGPPQKWLKFRKNLNTRVPWLYILMFTFLFNCEFIRS